jgi:hypothetical protein
MKQLLALPLFILLIASAKLALAQEPVVFTGNIDYVMTVIGGDLSVAERAQAESQINLLIGEKPWIMKKTSNIMGNSTEILMPDSLILILEQMGQKIAYGLGKDVLQKNDSASNAAWEEIKDKIKYEYLSESKLVAGKDCKKAVDELDGNYYDIYYLDEYILPEGTSDIQMRGLKGLPLEYSLPLPNFEGASVLFTAKTFKYKKKVKPAEFKVPAGVEVQSGEELKKMLGL